MRRPYLQCADADAEQPGNSAHGDSATSAAAGVRAGERFVVLVRDPRQDRVTVRATTGAGERAVAERARLIRARGMRLLRCLLHIWASLECADAGAEHRQLSAR